MILNHSGPHGRAERKARGNKYRQACEKAGLTPSDVARELGLKDPSAVRHWFLGTARPSDVLGFARLVCVPVEKVLSWG